MDEQAITLLMENGPGNIDVKAFIMQQPDNPPARIVTTYQVTDGDGEEIDSGFEGDEEGTNMEVDEWDIADGITTSMKAADFIVDRGGSEPSASFFHHGVWYSTPDDEVDYHTGERTQRSYHLKGFSPEEEAEVYKIVRGRR